MKKILSDPINVFMSLAVVYLLSFIGVALLCSWFAVQHLSKSNNIKQGTGNIEY